MKSIEQTINVKADDNKKSVTKALQQIPAKKEQVKNSKNSIMKKQLSGVEEKYRQVANLNYCQSEDVRNEIIEIIEELWKIEGLVIEKSSGHDLTARFKGRQVLRLCPLKNSFSASIRGGQIQRYPKDILLNKVKEELKKEPSKVRQQKPTDEHIIEALECRIENMSKDSKGISTKGLKITDGIKKWIKQNGYSLTGETLLVNRVE